MGTFRKRDNETMKKAKKSSWVRGPYRKAKTSKTEQKAPPPRVAMPVNLSELRPRDRLDAIHAMQALLDYRQRQGELVEIAEVEAGHAEMREIIRNDLIGTLPLRLAGQLAGKVRQPAEVRAVVLESIRDMIRGWVKAGIPAEGVE